MPDLCVQARVEEIAEDGTYVILRLLVVVGEQVLFSSDPQQLAVEDVAQILFPLEVGLGDG